MGLDDVRRTVDSVMWAALVLAALVLLLAWTPAAAGKLGRAGLALGAGALCWTYNIGLLLWGKQPFSLAAGIAGVVLGLVTAARLSLSEWTPSMGRKPLATRVLGVLAVWSTIAVVLFVWGRV